MSEYITMVRRRPSHKRKGKSLEKQLKGTKAALKGLTFEIKVANWLADQDYKIKLRSKSKRLGEVDMIAERKVGILRKREVIFVECKNKKKITLKDFHRFVTKFERFLNREPDAFGLFIYRGELDKDVKDYYRKTLDPEIADLITLKKWRR